MIRFLDIQKTYDNGTKALKGVNLRIDDGEFAFLVGPSGSGKSTIIKLITGEVEPSGGRPMRAVGASPREIRKRIPYVLDLVGLARKEDRYPTQLSGGEQQRVAIARALVNNPKMIIADEPTGNLDPGRSLEIMMLLEKINELGTTMLVVTHEKELVNRFSKRVIAIENGRIISDETGGYYKNEEII